jgi:hypothetical protein
VEPPSLAGADQLNVTLPFPAVALTLCGAEGVVAALAEGMLAIVTVDAEIKNAKTKNVNKPVRLIFFLAFSFMSSVSFGP